MFQLASNHIFRKIKSWGQLLIQEFTLQILVFRIVFLANFLEGGDGGPALLPFMFSLSPMFLIYPMPNEYNPRKFVLYCIFVIVSFDTTKNSNGVGID